MSAKFTVNHRQKTGKGPNRQLRAPKEGLPHNPGVVYGYKTPLNVSMPSGEAWRFIKSNAKSQNKRFDLEIIKEDGSTVTKKVIIQDYQLSPVGTRLLHVDFREVGRDTMVNMEIPIHTTGVSKATKLGGVLQVLRHTIMVRGKLDVIPAAIEIDITDLDFGHNIHANDIKFPEGVSPVLAKDENYTVITVSTATAEEEAPEVAASAEDEAPESEAESGKKPAEESASTAKK